jgi:hypothetical protein
VSRQVNPRLRYRGVEVVAAATACAAAQALKGLRLLTVEAPHRLPLRDCDRPDTCRCVYRHFDDRREGPRRENERAKIPIGHAGVERRKWRGRRDSDYD